MERTWNVGRYLKPEETRVTIGEGYVRLTTVQTEYGTPVMSETGFPTWPSVSTDRTLTLPADDIRTVYLWVLNLADTADDRVAKVLEVASSMSGFLASGDATWAEVIDIMDRHEAAGWTNIPYS